MQPQSYARPAPQSSAATTPDDSPRDDRAADLDRRARIACTTRVIFGLGLTRERAALIAHDVIDTYLEHTRSARC